MLRPPSSQLAGPLAKSPDLHPSPQYSCLKGTWDLLTSSTKPHREQGKEAIPAAQLFTIKEWVWSKPAGEKMLGFRSKAWSGVQPTPQYPQESNRTPIPPPTARVSLEIQNQEVTPPQTHTRRQFS